MLNFENLDPTKILSLGLEIVKLIISLFELTGGNVMISTNIVVEIGFTKITKSLILFNLTKQEKEFFVNNPHEWGTRRKLNLNIYEIGYLYCFLMNYFC